MLLYLQDEVEWARTASAGVKTVNICLRFVRIQLHHRRGSRLDGQGYECS
jgi:hypothetical protein